MRCFVKLLVFFFVVSTAYAQDETGIQFDHERSWQEILQKAKAEKKLIYVDAYTTWCGPCKQMSAQVFPKKEVGEFYNTNFISFKAQIDTGKNDADYVKARYTDFRDLAQNYKVQAYPTHLFINGDGELVHKGLGSMSAEKFLELGNDVLNPDKQYGTLKKKFDSGNRESSFLVNLIKASSSASDEELAAKAMDFYMTTQNDMLTDENIRLVHLAVKSFKDKAFNIIKNNPERFDKVLGEGKTFQKYYNLAISEVLYPMMSANMDEKPNFTAVQTALKKSIGEVYAKEITKTFQLSYYQSENDLKNFEKIASAYEGSYLNALELNSYAWYIFEKSNSKPLLQKALQWALKSVEKEDKAYNNDTVANLYYKLNQKDKAVTYQQKALDLARKEGIEPEEYEKTLAKFKSGK